MPRHDGRADDQPRPLSIERNYLGAAPGRVLIRAGATTVLCTASVSSDVPPWLAGRGKGWVTAEYSMLPGSTSPRKPREKGKPDGRSTEIQRLIGRSLRAGVDMHKLGERLITVDCDVLQADGGTRTASITGGWVALVDAIASLTDPEGNPLFAPGRTPLTDSIAAVSVGVVAGSVVADLDYVEDSQADVDMNLVMTGSGQFIEVQGSAEGATFSTEQLSGMIAAGSAGIQCITQTQRECLGPDWPL
ncbi:ribonuclease PH [Botrimarina hoheduenensis]|uniref:Ribonuclease PH n=1 Tax=Botrimarina hoheduenensis TaxID=2528000 RepID=A0A5C5WC87_9BACT|nr:ribonuclease PH [Botrimarina hoheduenensis]TWT47675.1 Ribonuclease PH [Botrimarina hoheduenensis]